MRRPKQAKTTAVTTLPPPVENLLLALSSPRGSAKGTIVSYALTATKFLDFAGNDTVPGEKELRSYFLERKQGGINDRTLGREFSQLKKLYQANHWDWPFTADDQPQPKELANTPAFTLEEVATLIRARDEYSRLENFCLAVSITWGLMRQEILGIRKRDYDADVITIKLARRRSGASFIRHIIPEEIKPIFLDYHPRLRDAATLSYAFQRVLLKSGLGKRPGYGYHSIRRSLRTLLERNLAREGLPLPLVADFMGWSATTKAIVYGGAPMPGVNPYLKSLSNDPFVVDRLVLKHHPFLGYYR